MDFLEFPEAVQELRGAMCPGKLRLTNQAIIFKNCKTGKVDQVSGNDVEVVSWQKLADGYGIRLFTKQGHLHRYGGFRDSDLDKLSKFFNHSYNQTLQEKDISLKGWNWGHAKFIGSVLSFEVDEHSAFDIPLMNVSQCSITKNEVTLEFHQNDDAYVSLMELRFHIPTDATDAENVQAFHDKVMNKASVIQATGDAMVTLKEIQCLTPRGRYDIKVFPSFIQLHGKTFDYKIPLETILRLFLLPHRDQRQMFFVVSLDPPIKQGQTRYHFLILLFSNDDETSLELSLSEEDLIEKYEGKLQKEMSGPTYEVTSRVMKAIINKKITVPGSFVGNSGTPAIGCSYKAAAGFLYPLERGFIYIHKPPVHIRFEEIASVNFARSGGSTRSFDFEIETRNTTMHTFSSIEKEEYGKLFDFISNKKLRVKNRGSMDNKAPAYKEEDLDDSEAEDAPDAYLARVKAEAKEREDESDAGGGSSDDESDASFKPAGSGSDVAEEYDSNPPDSSDSEKETTGKAGSDSDASGKKEKKRPKKKDERKSKKAKTVPEGRKPRKKKKPKDANKPKRPQSAYFLWLNENRDRIKKEHPHYGVADVAKKAGEEWRELKDKSEWERKSAEAKKEYEQAMKAYKENAPAKADDSDDERGTSKAKKKKPKTPQKKTSSPTKPPPKGGFLSKEFISDDSSGSSSGSEKKPSKKTAKQEAKKKAESSASEKESSAASSDAASGGDSD